MMKKSLIAALLLFASWNMRLGAEVPLKHIRVIVDTSASLHHTDPSGYVKLSTELFYDLALKELDPNDTFKVAHFPDKGDPSWPKSPTPPETIDKKYVLEQIGRNPATVSNFHMHIRKLPYTSQYTYFSPGIQWALKDLQASGTSNDNRVVVLITDGKPDSFAEAEDSKRLAALVAPLRENGVRVFVLAFGTEVDQDWFNNAFGFGSPSGVKGQVFAGADAGHLLTDMLQIFSLSFGFSKESITPGKTTLDVARDATLQRAVVVALYRQAGRPEFQLAAPAGQSAGTVRATTEAAEHDPDTHQAWKSISYAYQWLEPPAKGEYTFQANGPPPDEIAILRPVRVQSTIRKYQGNSTDVVMAGKPAPMEVLVSPSNGTTGDPGPDIRVRYYLNYFKPGDEGRDAGKQYQTDASVGVQTPEGRVFVIRPEFIKNPSGWPPGTPYQAYIDVEVTQFDTPVDRMGTRMHHVTVYPYLAVGVNPNPAVALTSGGKESIHGGQAGCVSSIQFVDNAQSLASEPYSLAVRLLNPLENSGEWKGAKFRFDGKEFSGNGADWQATETINPRDLADSKHTFCVIAGEPSAHGNEDLQVHFGLWRNGADVNERELNIVDDLVVKVDIAAPDAWQIWSPWLILLLTALLTYLLLLLLRSKQILPPDLSVSLAAHGGQLAAAVTAPKSFGAGWFGFPQDKPVFSMEGDREIGSVRPTGDGLFIFHPGRGFQNVNVQSSDGWVPVEPGENSGFRLLAGVTYQAGLNNDVHLFRIHYSQERPRI
jgi:hypothetical protein